MVGMKFSVKRSSCENGKKLGCDCLAWHGSPDGKSTYRESDEEAGLADTRVTDEEDLEEVVAKRISG